jgi:ABC-type branched-subunit amino acid transport system substrate-binding protein
VEERGFEQVAAVSVRSNYGNEAARAIDETFEDLEVESALVLDLQHNSRDTDYAAMAARVVESGAQAALVWSAQPVAQGLLD